MWHRSTLSHQNFLLTRNNIWAKIVGKVTLHTAGPALSTVPLVLLLVPQGHTKSILQRMWGRKM